MGEARPSLFTFSGPDVSAERRGLGESTVAIRESPVYLPGGITVGHYYILSKQERRMRETQRRRNRREHTDGKHIMWRKGKKFGNRRQSSERR